MIETNNNTYNQVKHWVLNRSKNVISFSPIAVFKDIKADKLEIVKYLNQLCDENILHLYFIYTCKCGESYIEENLVGFPNYCEVCGEKITNILDNSFLEYKILKRECNK